MILLPPWQSKFCPRLCIKQGHCCRPHTLPLTSIGSTRHFWHSSNCWGRDGIWDKVTNLQTVSHNTSVCASYLAHPLPVPLNVQSDNQFCVLSVQPGHHITSQPSPSLFMKPRAPSPWTLILDTKLQRNRQFVFFYPILVILNKPRLVDCDPATSVWDEYWMVEVETFYLDSDNWARVQLGTKKSVWMFEWSFRGHQSVVHLFFLMLWARAETKSGILRNLRRV